MQNFQNSQDISSLDISNQPEMETKKEPKNKRIYIKFSAENLVRLNELYEKRTYPTKKEMRKLSLVSQEPLKKLENWFKHKRRTDIKNGLLKFSVNLALFPFNEVSLEKENLLPNRQNVFDA